MWPWNWLVLVLAGRLLLTSVLPAWSCTVWNCLLLLVGRLIARFFCVLCWWLCNQQSCPNSPTVPDPDCYLLLLLVDDRQLLLVVVIGTCCWILDGHDRLMPADSLCFWHECWLLAYVFVYSTQVHATVADVDWYWPAAWYFENEEKFKLYDTSAQIWLGENGKLFIIKLRTNKVLITIWSWKSTHANKYIEGLWT